MCVEEVESFLHSTPTDIEPMQLWSVMMMMMVVKVMVKVNVDFYSASL